MDPIAPVAGRFISAVRRRILLVRIGESIAISVGVASAAGLMVLPILWWRGQAALPLAAVMLTAGSVLGVFWGISRRPSRLEAAIEADTQLALDDLLGTVMLLGKGPTSVDWQRTVAAFADDRCRSLHPSEIIVNRIGLRGWAGVGILGGLLLTFALLISRPADVTAASSMLGQVPVDSSSRTDVAVKSAESLADASRPPGSGGVDSNSIGGFEQDRMEDSARSMIGKDSAGRSSTGMDSSAGGRRGTTYNPRISDREARRIPSDAREQTHRGAMADGIGQSDSHIGAAGENNSTSAAAGGDERAGAWTADRGDAGTAANGAVGLERVPREDADLVRDYFRRD